MDPRDATTVMPGMERGALPPKSSTRVGGRGPGVEAGELLTTAGGEAHELDADEEIGGVLRALGAPADLPDGFDDLVVQGNFDPQLVPAVDGEVLADADHGAALGEVDDRVPDRPEPQAGQEPRPSQDGGRPLDPEPGLLELHRGHRHPGHAVTVIPHIARKSISR